MPNVSAETVLAERLRWQADACARIGSPLYSTLLELAATDLEAHGPSWEVLRGHETDPESWLPGLRLMGAVNRLALNGSEPALAGAYEEFCGDGSDAWEAMSGVLERNSEQLRRLIDLPVQTNEVGRCAPLLLGFLELAAETGMPLRLLEVGASAGLNLRWDHYGYRAADFAWGAADSPLQIEFALDGELANLPSEVEIGERRGCDAAPIDAATPEGRLSLLAYVWPDQTTRVQRVRAALGIAAGAPVDLDRESATPWARRMLAEPRPGQATVIYHSIVSMYLSDEERDAFHECIDAAGQRATAEAPLAWLRLEPATQERADLHLTTWPGGETRHLARVGYHGTPVELPSTRSTDCRGVSGDR
jgi:hypothetical protein